MFLFGVFRLGALSEFFPSSALQGMLAAIGIGILSKQVHVMIGVTSVSGKPLEVLSKIPESLKVLFSSSSMEIILPALLGVLSLLILVFYSKLRNPLFKLIPAPMWVVFLAIGLNYYYDLISSQEYPISPNLLISLPDNIWSDLPTPDFGIALTVPFLSTVFSITLISSIESLLSNKAVDKLDPQKRRSKENKDLRAVSYPHLTLPTKA